MSASLADLLAYVGFSEADERALRQLHARVEPRLTSIINVFYAAIEADPEANSILADDAQVGRLKLSLLGWVNRVLAGPWDAEYAKLRERIGHVHVRVGLPQRFMLTSMSVIRAELHAAVDELCDSASESRRAHQALARILDVDLAIMLETYREDSLDAVRRLEEFERKLLADELNLSEERYRAVLESAEVIAIAIGRDDSIKLFNRQAELVSGRTRTEILTASDLGQVWHPSDRSRIEAALGRTRTGTASHVFEARLVNKKQETHFVRWHVSALPPIDDGEVCFIGVDLTAERELAGRTRRVEQLATLGTLAAGLAHEIRNPLNAAQLQLTVAERRLARVDANLDIGVEPMGIVRGELDRLAKLVADFLAYARPTPLKLRPIDLRAASHAVVELMAPVAASAGVELVARVGEAVTAQCDEEQCRQVLLNLIKNAIEAARPGGGHVEIDVRRDGPSSYVVISDDGRGFPSGINIFEPFATSKEGGTGLGLSIVKRIVDQHGGTVSTHRVGSKTIFEIELPRAGPQSA